MNAAIFNASFGILAFLTITVAKAQDAFIGDWKVTHAEVAPWVARSPNLKLNFDSDLRKGIITIATDRFRTPVYSGVECLNPKYKIEIMSAKEIFEGNLYDPSRGLTDAEQLARKIGFGNEILTLVTGCYGMQYHMNNIGNIVFAFYNVIYTAERVQ